MAAPLLSTKLYIPRFRPGLVSRPRLIDRLNAGMDRKLTLVSAAAGFGKTTLVAEWLDQLGCPRTWLSLDKGDNDPVQFVAYLIAALQKVDAAIGGAAESLLGAPQLPPLESLVSLLINDIAATSQSFVLVLDDYDAIHAESIHEAVGFLIEHQPSQLQLVLVTRQDPPLPIPRLRVRRQMVEIGEQELRFRGDEVQRLLSQVLGLDLDPQIVHALDARTEGWAAGLHLAALSMQARPADQIAEFVDLFGGSHRHVIDYLADEVLSQQSEEVRVFLCQTSILERFSAPLCDAVTGRSDSREILRQLDQANLFLVPLDDQREWYRYHRLFADFLRTELDAETRASLHGRASRWLVGQGLLPEAVTHALASEDLAQAADVIALASADAFRLASLVTLQNWLAALPDEVVRGDTELATYQGYLLFFTARTSQAMAYCDAAEKNLPADATPASRGRLLSLKAHLALCTSEIDAADRFAREALECLDEGDAVYRNLTSNLLGQVLEMKGDVVSAVDVYREAVHGGWGAVNQVGALVVLTNLVFALNELGRREEALAVCRQAVELQPLPSGRAMPVSDGIHMAWSLLSYEANELELAQEQALRALELAERANIADGVLWSRLILARVYLASGDPSTARQLAQEGQRTTSRLDVYEGKVQLFAAVEAQANLLQGDIEAVARWAEEAGLHPEDSPHHWDEFTYLAYARLLLAQDRLEEALQILTTMEGAASRSLRRRKLITIYLLQAIAWRAAGRAEQAVDRVAKAVDLAAGEGYLRAFLDEGSPIIELLPGVRGRAPGFVAQVLDAAAVPVFGRRMPGTQALVEPLSERELEILRLIALGRSNPEIADILYLSLNTVKWHAKNLYGKLGVGNRIEAVARAQELGLL